MKLITALVLLMGIPHAVAFTPDEDPDTIGKYQKAFKESKGQVWDMDMDDNVYFDCNTFSARAGSAEIGFFGFKVTMNGVSHEFSSILTNSQFDGASLVANKDEVYARRGSGDFTDPLELIAIRVGKPISIESPMIDHYKKDNTPAERTIMSRPLYVEVSTAMGSQVGYTVKPLSTTTRSTKFNRSLGFTVKSYGVCYFSKFNSQLNNSGMGYPGNTRHPWDEAASSPWGAHSSPERAF